MEHPGRLHLREIARRASTSAGTTARELTRLEAAGLVWSQIEGRQRYYTALSPSPDARAGRAGEALATYDRSVDAILGSILRRLVEAYQPEAVYLFGSRARGQADPDSDYDLLIVVPADAPEARRRPQLAVQALRGVGVPVDAVTRPAFDLRAHVVNSLPEAALREGRLLYGA
ncbi:MAG TPA: nucleotidyltransferase domain-containing protein [Patescibacteria group bacterium]|nr:nucleotidyltransferase domain-containing protein [Patescibacteria group bacterium]